MTALDVVVIVVGIFLALLSHEYIYPYWYQWQARKRGCDRPLLISAHPFGIPRVITMLRRQKAYTMLPMLKKEAIDSGSKRTGLLQMPGMFHLFTTDPENIKSVLATNFKDYSLGHRYNEIAPVFGDGIFTLSGQGWKHSRAMLRPQFAREQISRLGQVSHHANVLVQAIEYSQRQSQFIDIQRLFHLLTMDTATEFLFGSSIQSLNAARGHSSPEVVSRKTGERISSDEFVTSYTFLNGYAFRRAILNKLCFLLNSGEYREHRRRARVFIDYFVDQALDATATNALAEKSQEEGYIFAHELAKVTRDPITIRDQIFNILIAGRDTTASTMSFTLYFLAQHQQVFEKLRAEILENFGGLQEDREITYEMLRQSRYLNAVINEVLRLAPVVPLNFREAIRDTTLPRGGGPDGDQPVYVPKGTPVNYSVYAMHRDPNIWGDDAEEFIPERWERSKYPENPWGYLPFNGGPRICLGQQFALTEIALTMVRLFQRYSKIEMAPEFPVETLWWNTLTLQNGPPGVPVRLS